jgi:predicted ATPase
LQIYTKGVNYIYELCGKLKSLKTKRIVISGGPGSGKTTLVSELEQQGHCCMHEISRDVILEAQKEGIAQLFLENPLLFSQKLMEGRLKQYHETPLSSIPFLFYDRGMPDVTAYMDYIHSHYPTNFSETCMNNRYDSIFSEKIYHYLLKGYQNYGYHVYEVPVGSIENRIHYILSKLKIIP